MKKLALLFVSLVLVFSLSAVFATEEEAQLLVAPASETEVSGEVEAPEVTAVEEENDEEVISGEEVDALSGEVISEENTTETAETPVTENETSNETTTSTSTNNGSIVGAIIAVVIVVAVVAIAAILRKD